MHEFSSHLKFNWLIAQTSWKYLDYHKLHLSETIYEQSLLKMDFLDGLFLMFPKQVIVGGPVFPLRLSL